jgi:hypothetical protein
MDKKGFFEARKRTDAECHAKCIDYLARCHDVSGHRVARYRSDRGYNYGVVVNSGPEKTLLWDSFKEKLESFSTSEFERRLDCYDPALPA